MTVHACILGQLHILGKGVRRNRHNRHLATTASQRTDSSGCLIAVHNRHLDIHKDKVEPALRRLDNLVHSLLAVFRSFNLHLRHTDDAAGNLSVQLVILDYQHTLLRIVASLQLCHIIPWLFRFLMRDKPLQS